MMAFLKQKTVVFCDFDGTITKADNITSIMQKFNPPGWKKIKDDILGQRMSIQKGVGLMFSLLDTSEQEEIIRYAVDQAEIRPGFDDFVQYCIEQDIQLLITSGGIDFFVFPILSRFNIPKENIYCNASDFSGNRIKILWPFPCDDSCNNDCGMCKSTIIRSFPEKLYKKIIIGDSITDLAGAKLVTLVIARDFLLEKCKEYILPYKEFDSFFDIIDILKQDNREAR